jgi:hypothetical protein
MNLILSQCSVLLTRLCNNRSCTNGQILYKNGNTVHELFISSEKPVTVRREALYNILTFAWRS